MQQAVPKVTAPGYQKLPETEKFRIWVRDDLHCNGRRGSMKNGPDWSDVLRRVTVDLHDNNTIIADEYIPHSYPSDKFAQFDNPRNIRTFLFLAPHDQLLSALIAQSDDALPSTTADHHQSVDDVWTAPAMPVFSQTLQTHIVKSLTTAHFLFSLALHALLIELNAERLVQRKRLLIKSGLDSGL